MSPRVPPIETAAHPRARSIKKIYIYISFDKKAETG